jgi:hypothetical protein
MVRNRLPALVLALLLPLSLPASAEAPVRSGNAVFDGLVRTVDENFYRPAELDAFRDNVRKTVSETPALAGPNADAATVDHAIDRVLTGLHTSHTARYKQTQVDYYELLDVFRFGVRDAVRRLYPPDGEIAYPGIGIASKEIDGKRFVTDVYDGGPAALAGAKAGDEILSVDGLDRVAPAPFNVGDPLLRRPRHQGELDVTYSAGRLTAYGELTTRGEILDVEPNYGGFGGLFFSPGYAVVNAGAAVRVTRQVAVYVRVLNLADRNYEEVLGYPALRRNGVGGVRLTF